ncbi:TIM barrel protein [Candidatus Pelagibacter sp.]|nr:TIM barrel protein [Candidatus Pelagibacter sp.]
MKKNVFVSTGFYKKNSPNEIIKIFINNKIRSIELSGGKHINKSQINKLKLLNNKGLKIRIHNYFPAPRSPFVINLASESKVIIKKSISQLKKSILLAKDLNNEFFSFHAGFRVDPKPKQLGKKLKKISLVDKKKAEKIFFDNLILLNLFAKKNNVKLLIENNVVNKKNFETFGGNPLLMTNPIDIISFFEKLPKDIGFLLDVGHLKVSSKTEKFDLNNGMIKLKNIVTGYHLSENNGLEDQNKNFARNAWFLRHLKKNLNYYTLEIYKTNLDKIYKTKLMLENFLAKKIK